MMALKVLVGTSGFWVRHLTTSAEKQTSFPKLVCNSLLRRFLSHPSSSYGGGTESENVATAVEHAKKVLMIKPIASQKITYEAGLREFLSKKGADKDTIDSIISKYPRAVLRNAQSVETRWNIWKSILKTENLVLQTLVFSPHSFFKLKDAENMQENLTFLTSLGLSSKSIFQMMTKAPWTFSCRMERNIGAVECLENLCTCLGGHNPKGFAKKIIAKNIYVLSKNSNQIKANSDLMKALLKIPDKEMLNWLEGKGAKILDIGHSNLKKRIESIYNKLQPLGFSEEEITQVLFRCPLVLFLSSETFNSKVDLLLDNNIDARQILGNPYVMFVSTKTIHSRLMELTKYAYDFDRLGIGVLTCCSSRFNSKLQKIQLES